MDVSAAIKSVRPKGRLSDAIWSGSSLLPEIASALGRIAKKFIEDIELDLDVVDIVLTGSFAGMTWGPGSDLDLHIIIDFSSFKNQDAAKRACKLAKFKWEEEHDITIKGIPVEVYVESSDEKPPEATGRWSITKNKWVLQPPSDVSSYDESKVIKKVIDFRKVIQKALKTRKEGPIIAAMKRLIKTRKAGLTRAGELSSENLAFRILRRTNELQKAWDDVNNIMDSKLSI